MMHKVSKRFRSDIMRYAHESPPKRVRGDVL